MATSRACLRANLCFLIPGFWIVLSWTPLRFFLAPFWTLPLAGLDLEAALPVGLDFGCLAGAAALAGAGLAGAAALAAALGSGFFPAIKI